MRAVLIIIALSAVCLPAAAQQRPQQPRPQQPAADTSLTPAERAMAQLRALGAVARPDTISEPGDTLDARAVNVQGGAILPAPPSRIQRDSIMTLLMTVPGYLATEYSGGEARFNADSSRLVLRENAQVAREGNQLVADSSIVYEEAIALACGYGNPVLHGAGMTNPVVSDTVCYDIRRQAGFARGAATRVDQGAEWNVRCNAYFVGDNLYCHDAIFTDCDLPHPHQHYHFAAGSLKVVRGNVMVARDLTLNFADVPVFWFPFMVQSLSRGRRSGLLMPRFGINDMVRTNARYSRRIEDVGVYLAINDYMGGEVALDWFSNNWTGLRGSMDYNWADRFLRGGLTFRRFWKEEGGTDFTLASQNSWQIDERTRVDVSGNYTTSTQFVQSRSLDPRELNRSIDSNASLRRRFDWGNMSLGAKRRQFLHNNTVELNLPSLDLSISPLTLFEAAPGEESWYSNATWQGGGSFKMDRTDISADNIGRGDQSRRNLSSRANSSLSIGRVSWSQNISMTEQERLARQLPGDTVALPASYEQRGDWSTSLNFQQRLMGTSTLTPGLTLGSAFIRNDSTQRDMVYAPMRVDFNASLRTDLFGFWPGAGPFERVRHKLSPNISYNYSPEARADSLQRAVFRRAGVSEQNRISIGIAQTFEAKYRAVEADADTDPTDAPAGAEAEADAAAARGEPVRRQQTQTITLLSLSTDALVYDFVEARDSYGLMTTQISSSVQSDLLRGLQLSFTHDLFRQDPTITPRQLERFRGQDDVTPDRVFAMHLSNLNASFSLSGDSWLFRILRLGSRDTVPRTGTGVSPGEEDDPSEGGPAFDGTQSEYGMVGTSRRFSGSGARGRVGAWNASLRYSLVRPRDTRFGGQENQMVQGNFSFQPTENWSLRWSTGYSFTASEFTDHYLTLTRMLHDWDANFDFVKAQNGNFSFQFRVHLRANPDVKLDYSQSDMQGVQRIQQQR